MSPLKINIDQLKNYLNTGLEGLIIYPDSTEMCRLNVTSGKNNVLDLVEFLNGTYQVKPICYHLSDLDNYIPEMGFVPIEELILLNHGYRDWMTIERKHWIEKYGHNYWLGRIPHVLFEKLIHWNFWPFGDEYFDDGLVINKLMFEK